MRTILLSAALFFALSEAGVAQCGWVLWGKEDPGVEDGKTMLGDPDRWTAYDGFADINECRAAGEAKLNGIAMLYRKELGFTVEVSGRNGLFNNPKTKNVFNLEMLCFPGNFDPRGK